MQIQSYLFFDGRCEEAIEFYKGTLGAKVETLMRFKDSPEPAPPGMCPPGSESNVMHSSFRVGDTLVMASDGMGKGKPEFKGFSLSVDAATEAEADRLFAALGKGGQVQMPLAKTFFSPRFGMVADRFGVSWMVIVLPQGAIMRAAAKRSVQHGAFTIERELAHPPTRVFAAWADRRAKEKWFGGPSEQWKILERQMDFRVGGSERARGQWTGGRVSDFQAYYQDIVQNRRIVYSYTMHIDKKKISVSLATIEFEPSDKGTTLILTEQGAFLDGYDDAGSRESGTQGLMNALEKSLGGS